MKRASQRRTSPSKPEKAAEALPKFAVSLFLIILIWLFAELIFLPLSAELLTKELSGRVTSIVAAAFILAIASLLPQTAQEGDAAVRLLSGLLAKGRYESAKRERTQQVYENLGRATLSVLLGVIVSSLLYWISTVFGGMALLVTIVVAFFFIFQSLSQASEEILQKITS